MFELLCTVSFCCFGLLHNSQKTFIAVNILMDSEYREEEIWLFFRSGAFR